MESKIHYGVKCSSCQMYPITGIRYKCIQCNNFNFCEKCEEKYGQNHGHILLKLRDNTLINMIQNKQDSKGHKLKQNKKISPTFKCENSSLYFKTLNNNHMLVVPIKLVNNSNVNWPMPCYFACKEEDSEIKGERVRIFKCSGEPGQCADLKVQLNLKNIKKSGEYKSLWTLQDENGNQFGPTITITVNDDFQENLKLKPYYRIKQFNNKINDMNMQPITTEELLKKYKK